MANNTNLFELIMNTLFSVLKRRDKFKEIKADPDLAAKSNYFAAHAIVESIVYTIGIVASAFGVGALLNWTDGLELILTIFKVAAILVCVGALIICLTHFLVGTLLSVIYQLRLNRRAIGWVALVVWLACLVLAVVLAFVVLNQLE